MKTVERMIKEQTTSKYLNIVIPIGWCILFFIFNFSFLEIFPFVHSDETWLSGLSRTMLETGNIASTEYFFDIYERNPHALKILFHAVEIGWISLCGYSIQTIRVLSLLAGTAALYLLYQIIFKITNNRRAAIFGMAFLSVDIQYIYAAHTARQEIWLILILLIALNLSVKSFTGTALFHKRHGRYSLDTAAGVSIGLAFGFHPNGLIIFFPVLGYYIYKLFSQHEFTLKKFLFFIGAFGITASIFFTLSFIFNPHFLTDYAAYGETLGVLDSPGSKLSGWIDFYKKIYYQVSGTYYTPNVRPQFFFFGFTLFVSLLTAVLKPDSRKRLIPLLIGFAGMQAAFILIGRYGQPSVVLNLPLLVIISVVTCSELLSEYRKNWIKYKAISCCLLAFLGSAMLSEYQISAEISQNSAYNEYLDQITSYIPTDSKVLCNINAEPLFGYGNLYDWRNIGKLSDSGLGFAQYINDRNIEYIVYPEEIDYIYQHRPLWNGIYGNIALIYDEMQDFLIHQCEEINSFPSRTYAMRIVRYQQEREWTVTLYRVIP